MRLWRPHAQVQYVKGIDLSPAEVAEAARRYNEMSSRDKGAQTRGGGMVPDPVPVSARARGGAALLRQCGRTVRAALNPFAAPPRPHAATRRWV